MIYPVSVSASGLDVSQYGAYMTFVCDTAEDIAALPTNEGTDGVRVGSIAYCWADSQGRKSVYMLDSSRTWTFVKEVS